MAVASPRVRCCDARGKKYAPGSSWFQEFFGFTPGATELGSCLTDATRKGRARRNVRVLAAMRRAERIAQQSSRPFDPVEACRPPCHKGYKKNLGLPEGNVKRRRRRRRGATRWHICACARHPLDLCPLSGQYRVLRGLDGRRPIGACR